MTNKRILTLIFVVAFLTLLAGCFPSVNQAPIITSDPVKTAKVGVTYIYDVEATDPDEDVLTYSLTTKPSGMTIDSATGVISWLPSFAQVGDHAVTVVVSDDGSPVESTIQNFTIKVSKPSPTPTPPLVNHAPIITSIPGDTAIVGVEYTYTIKATDQDGDTLTYSFVSGPKGMAFDTPTISWTPGTTGSYDVTVKVSDGKKATTQSFTITVEAVEVISIEVEPNEVTLRTDLLEEKTQQLEVTAYYSDGTSADITSDCIYLTSASAIASVGIGGLVTAENLGKTTINVLYTPDGIVFTDTVEVTVGPVHNVTQNFYRNTIQAAVGDVLTKAGDTIEVAAGTYDENITIPNTLSGLQLLGAGKTSSVISITTGTAIFVGSKNPVAPITIQGFGFNGNNGNKAYAIEIRTSGDSGTPGIIADNSFENFKFAIKTPDIGVRYWNISNNEFDGNRLGMYLSGSYYEISDNVFENYKEAVSGDYDYVATDHLTIQDNQFLGGIHVMGADLTSADVAKQAAVLFSSYSHDVSVTGNEITNSTTGVLVKHEVLDNEADLSNVVVNLNNIVGNTNGVVVEGTPDAVLDATDNWWGDASGPSGGVADPVTGIIANGTGDTVSINVNFDPWTH